MFQQPFDLIKIDQSGRPLWLCATKTREEARKKAQVERTLDPNYEFRLLNTLTGRIEVFVVAELVDQFKGAQLQLTCQNDQQLETEYAQAAKPV